MKNVSLGIFDPSLGIFDPARCRRNPDFWVVFRPKTRSVLRNRQGIPRLSRVSSRARERKTRGGDLAATRDTATNPELLDAFTLVIIGAGQQPAYPGLPGHEPDMETARRQAQAVVKAADELRKVAP